MRAEESCAIADPVPRCAGGPADRSERTEPKRFHTPRVRGDSIGFGGCDLKPKREALKLTDGQDLKNTEPNVALLEQKAGENITGDFRSPQPQVFDYIDAESDLIQVIESSLEYHGDFRIQSPTFFPTDLEITLAPGLRDRAPRHHSVDSEDDDYYDNQILPFYESYAQLNDRNIGEPISASGSNKTTQETDRLKSQLKEAYYLLINTMHNISFDGQVEDNGFVDQASSASQSIDSISTGSDASEERLFAFIGRCGVGVTGSSRSRSLQNIRDANPKPMLQRSVSDSKVRYSSNRKDEPRPAVASGRGAQLATPTETLTTPVSTRQSCDDATVPKHPGVTVNKMQEWMQKGRVLSSEMKQRIAGSSPRANHVRPAAMEFVCQRQTPFNHITVSKKRQWLQQSSVTAPPAAEEEQTQTPPPSNSLLTDRGVH
ncbi:uncharacterized protein, partial [Sinocyclocheilus grahami]|uniref:uncharacterized protein n=1 Tax=Sinocyclocheilus grahami TaxID=75366 RepID=UPI0007AD07DE